MRCKKCNSKLAPHDIWCTKCGYQSPVVRTELSAMRSLKQSRKNLAGKITALVPPMGFSIILGVIPIVALAFIFAQYLDNDVDTSLRLILNLSIKSILISLFVPFILIPFACINRKQNYELSMSEVIKALKLYPKYFYFSILNSIIISIFYLICFGFPGFASDPILRLVYLALINYLIAIALPAPVLMERHQLSPFKALVKSYRHFGDLRWNIYFLALVLGLLNLLAFVLLIFPMLFTLPLALYAIRDYEIKLEEFELLDYRI
nr:hypothetical protein [Candidatus Cloacimonadota bacterium]